MDNLKEFKELIERYESITLEKIESYIENDNTKIQPLLSILTGFGISSTCTLCLAIDGICSKCVYSYSVSENLITIDKDSSRACYYGENKETFFNILNSKTPNELLQAYKARAKHMRNILKQIDGNT